MRRPRSHRQREDCVIICNKIAKPCQLIMKWPTRQVYNATICCVNKLSTEKEAGSNVRPTNTLIGTHVLTLGKAT